MMTKQSAEAYQRKYYLCLILSLIDFYELATYVLCAYPNGQAYKERQEILRIKRENELLKQLSHTSAQYRRERRV